MTGLQQDIHEILKHYLVIENASSDYTLTVLLEKSHEISSHALEDSLLHPVGEILA